MKRQSGVLLPVFALPGKYGCGSFGRSATAFIDMLADAGFGVWQVLPLCLPDYCHSPYKSFSAFSGNPYFIDLDLLAEDGFLTTAELSSAQQTTPYSCEYERLERERMPLLAKAAERFRDTAALDAFFADHSAILEFCRFMALKEANGGRHFTEWTTDVIDEKSLSLWKFTQYIFYVQWQKIRCHAKKKGVSIIGDIPIYVADDSADVWAHPDGFLLDAKRRPTSVAGVPPDYFCADGQLWGNPIYDWENMSRDGYLWWRSRIRFMCEMFDGVRIDHFRAFSSYYSIPADAGNARGGVWKAGPGLDFLKILRREAGDALLIAEDLGDVDDEVHKLVADSGFPGMRVLQFAFLGDPATPHLPHNYINNCVAYTGTHDNNTLLGYIWEQSDENRRRILEYCGYHDQVWDRPEAYRAVVRTLFASAAGLVVLPLQDLLFYGNDTRINIPGKPDGNWRFRVTEEQLSKIDFGFFRRLNELYSRI